jgi:glycosyltransferase involved in cell wall biosynthesis
VSAPPSDVERLRIALWAPLPPPVGGISRWTVRFCEVARAHGLDVRVIDISPGIASVDERSRLEPGRLPVAWRALRALWRTLRRERPDVVHVTSSLFWATPRDALALALCRGRGVPVLLQIRSSSQIVAWREGLGGVRRRLLDRVLRLADVVLVLSSELEAYFERAIPGLRVQRIGNMVSEAECEVAVGGEPLLPPRREPCRILFVGHRMPLKGLGELAEAVLGLGGCELVVVGGEGGGAIDAASDRRMEDALARLRSEGRLVETGRVPPEDATRSYREADVFALPTHREGFPNTLLEAMAVGLPCVATPVGAIPEMLAGECGLLVPVGDVRALREALGRLVRDPVLRARLGRAARERVRERYSRDAVMRRYRALYLELARDGARRAVSPADRAS